MSDAKYDDNPDLFRIIKDDGELKKLFVNYVGEKHNPEDERVTVEMIVDTMAEEFPDFVLALAEENWVRGYQQAFYDLRGDLEDNDDQPQ